MFLNNTTCFKDGKFYFKIGFGLFFLAVLLYGLLSPLINGITLSEEQKADARNGQGFIEDKGDFILNYLSFFTIQTNIFVTLGLIFAAFFYQQEGKINNRGFGQYMVLAITTFIVITGIVFNVVLLPALASKIHGFFQGFTMMVQHAVVPIVMVIYFLIMPREQGSVKQTKEFGKKNMSMYYVYPIVGLAVMLVRGEFRGQAGKAGAYQYFFLNVHKSSYGLPGIVGLLIVAILIILIIFCISTLLNGISLKQLNSRNRAVNQTGQRGIND